MLLRIRILPVVLIHVLTDEKSNLRYRKVAGESKCKKRITLGIGILSNPFDLRSALTQTPLAALCDLHVSLKYNRINNPKGYRIQRDDGTTVIPRGGVRSPNKPLARCCVCVAQYIVVDATLNNPLLCLDDYRSFFLVVYTCNCLNRSRRGRESMATNCSMMSRQSCFVLGTWRGVYLVPVLGDSIGETARVTEHLLHGTGYFSLVRMEISQVLLRPSHVLRDTGILRSGRIIEK
jgi:hypothetical protein